MSVLGPKTRLVARREYRTRVEQRSFRISTAVELALALLLAFVPTIIQGFRDTDEAPLAVSVLDTSGADVAGQLSALLAAQGAAATDGARAIAFQPAAGSTDAERARVNAGQVDALLTVSRDASGDLAFAYATSSGATDMTAQRVYAAAAALSLRDRLQRQGIGPAAYQQIVTPPAFDIAATKPQAAGGASDTQKAAHIAVAYLLSFAMYLAVMTYGMWVAQGVVEEKSTRVMEIIATAASPRELLAGKIIGIGAAALTQFGAFIVVGGVAFSLQGRVAEALFGERRGVAALDLGGLSLKAGVAFLAFFILGFLLYAALYAGVGSMLSRQEDVNQVAAPMTMLSMAGFFGAIYALRSPDSPLARVLALFPFTSPAVMLTRIITGHPTPWEVALSLALLVAAVAAAIALAARIYRAGILHYGSRPTLRSMLTSSQARVSR